MNGKCSLFRFIHNCFDFSIFVDGNRIIKAIGSSKLFWISFMTPFLERKDEPSRMKKKKKQKTNGSTEQEGSTRIPKKSSLKSVTW